MKRFYFSRLTMGVDKGDLDKAELLYNGLNSNSVITYRKDNFKFVNGEILKIGSKVYVTGFLVKYKPDHEEQVVSDTNEFANISLKNKILAAVRFYIDTESSVIIHEESKAHIPNKSFSDRFKALFEENFKNTPISLQISAITENYDFFQSILAIKEIKRIVINLVPSNPNNADIWKDMDERLRKDKISNYREIQENKKKGESIVVDDETKSKFYMSEDGYGKSEVSGNDVNGKPARVSTQDSTRQAKCDIDGHIENPTDQISKLSDKLKDITKRTNEAT